jgi:flagellar basal body-associated protein FliL
MDQGPALLDLLISLFQSLVVLLLASGVYIALAVRKSDQAPPATAHATSPTGPRSVG